MMLHFMLHLLRSFEGKRRTFQAEAVAVEAEAEAEAEAVVETVFMMMCCVMS